MLKKGDKVYRVSDCFSTRLEIGEAIVVQASEKQVKITATDGRSAGSAFGWRTIFHSSEGLYTSKEEALEAFIADRENTIQSLYERIEEVKKTKLQAVDLLSKLRSKKG